MKPVRNIETGLPTGVVPRARTADETIHATTRMICKQACKDPLFSDAVVNAAAWIIASSALQGGGPNVGVALEPFREAVQSNFDLITSGGQS